MSAPTAKATAARRKKSLVFIALDFGIVGWLIGMLPGSQGAKAGTASFRPMVLCRWYHAARLCAFSIASVGKTRCGYPVCQASASASFSASLGITGIEFSLFNAVHSLLRFE